MRQGEARQGEARQGEARQGEARQGEARQGSCKQELDTGGILSREKFFWFVLQISRHSPEFLVHLLIIV